MSQRADLARGREWCEESAWPDAHAALKAADGAAGLAALDLELLAVCAYMLGRDDEYVSTLERAHGQHLASGDVPRAVRCGFWIGHSMLFRGQTARAAGWFGRAERFLGEADVDCVEYGYLLIPRWLEQMAHEDYEAGFATAADAAAIGQRFGDADLMWIARDEQGARAREARAAGRSFPARGRGPPGRRGGRALASNDGHRLLQHDRLLPRRVRPPSGTRLDGCSGRWCDRQPGWWRTTVSVSCTEPRSRSYEESGRKPFMRRDRRRSASLREF